MFLSFSQETVLYYVFVLLSLIPVTRIIMRAGLKPYWAGLLFVPDVGLAFCAAILVIRKWRIKESG